MSIFSLRESPLFRADSLTFVMAGLILFVVANVLGYSRRYLAGDQHQRSHQIGVLVLGASVMMMAFADHLLIFLIAWMVSNLLLVRLMIHKGQWIAARNSGYLAFKVFAFGGLALGVGYCAESWRSDVDTFRRPVARRDRGGDPICRVALPPLADVFTEFSDASLRTDACGTDQRWRISSGEIRASLYFAANFTAWVVSGRACHSCGGNLLEAVANRCQTDARLFDDGANGLHADAMRNGSICACDFSSVLAWFVQGLPVLECGFGRTRETYRRYTDHIVSPASRHSIGCG